MVCAQCCLHEAIDLAVTAAGDSVGGSQEGDWEVDGSVEDPGPTGGREVQPGGTRLPLLYGCGKEGAG